MAIQMRRGEKKDFNPEKLKVGEFAVPIDTGEVYIKTSQNVTKKLATLDGSGKLESMPTAQDVGAAPWQQVATNVDLNTLTADGIYELQFSTFENMNVPTALQNVATLPAKFLLMVANIDGKYSQTIVSEWGCYIRTWNQNGTIGNWDRMGISINAPVPIENGGTGANTASSALTNLGVVDLIYPVGSIYMSVNSTNPSTLFGGTWVSWGAGRVPVGVDTSDSDFSTVEKTGGEKTHTLTVSEMPNHNHHMQKMMDWDGSFIGTVQDVAFEQVDGAHIRMEQRTVTDGVELVANYGSYTDGAGNNQAHNNLQPYITCYMWKRTA